MAMALKLVTRKSRCMVAEDAGGAAAEDAAAMGRSARNFPALPGTEDWEEGERRGSALHGEVSAATGRTRAGASQTTSAACRTRDGRRQRRRDPSQAHLMRYRGKDRERASESVGGLRSFDEFRERALLPGAPRALA